MGTEFKTTTSCPATGVMCHVEIHYGKVGMKTAKLNAPMGVTAGYTFRLLLNSIPQKSNKPSTGYEVMLCLAVLTLQMKLVSEDMKVSSNVSSKSNNTILLFP